MPIFEVKDAYGWVYRVERYLDIIIITIDPTNKIGGMVYKNLLQFNFRMGNYSHVTKL